jgi:adenine-specific DNA methylase
MYNTILKHEYFQLRIKQFNFIAVKLRSTKLLHTKYILTRKLKS